MISYHHTTHQSSESDCHGLVQLATLLAVSSLAMLGLLSCSLLQTTILYSPCHSFQDDVLPATMLYAANPDHTFMVELPN